MLTGVNVQLDSRVDQRLNFQLSGIPNQAESTVSGTATLALSLPGISPVGTSALSASNTWQGGSGQVVRGGNFDFSTSVADLASYVLGSGQIQVTSAIQQARGAVSLANSSFFAENTLTGTYRVTWAGQTTLSYHYLLNAAPAFDADGATTLDVDFGEWFVGQDATTQAFEILNLLGGHRTGLDLDGFSALDPAGPFSADLDPFTGLAAGSSRGFNLALDTSQVGVLSDQIRLFLSDANVGFDGIWRNHELTINLRGSVVAQPGTAVPEPHIAGLVGVGLAALVFTRRRRV